MEGTGIVAQACFPLVPWVRTRVWMNLSSSSCRWSLCFSSKVRTSPRTMWRGKAALRVLKGLLDDIFCWERSSPRVAQMVSAMVVVPCCAMRSRAAFSFSVSLSLSWRDQRELPS